MSNNTHMETQLDRFYRLVNRAQHLEATQLHLSAGRRPVVRVGRNIREIPHEDVMHVDDLRQVVRQILTREQLAELEQHGDTVVPLEEAAPFICIIAKSVGSFTIMVKLTTDEEGVIDYA